MTQEEKAKAYDKAIEVAKRKICIDKAGMIDVFTPNDIYEIFPELAESEDERIRKAIKKALQVRCDGSRIISDEPVTLEEAIAWLEKQGEQKPVDKIEQKSAWSTRDEMMLDNCLHFLKLQMNHHASTCEIECCIDWLKSLKQRMEE